MKLADRKIIEKLQSMTPILWVNPCLMSTKKVLPELPFSFSCILDAQARTYRFAPLIMELFEDTRDSGGLIESELVEVPSMTEFLRKKHHLPSIKPFYVKADHNLPVAGSVKARGGVYEVLQFAEKLAIANGLLKTEDNYECLRNADVRKLFSRYTISVGSTGNLGYSVGRMGAALGFSVVVHMSKDAKEWKKERLRHYGVKVIEHDADYTTAVRCAREQSSASGNSYFVDDEDSSHLFLGYAAAAIRLQHQLKSAGIKVDQGNPLFVYLPCGIGGAPGGITFGLKHILGDHVHCFFAEPPGSPCMLLGLMSGRHSQIKVYDIGLDNKTEADGLAVSSPSHFVGQTIKNLISGVYTFQESDMFEYIRAAGQYEAMKLEPSATAGFAGPDHILNSAAGKEYLKKHKLLNNWNAITHLIWTTGGRFVPEKEYNEFCLKHLPA